MIVRAYESAPELGSLEYRRLLAPVDGSQRAEYALPLATNLAQSQDAQLIVAQVVTVPETPRRAPLSEEERDLVDRLVELNRREAVAYMDELRARLGDDVVTRVLVSDHAALRLHELIEEENIDLAVLSAHGYSGESRWPYGSVALNFIAYGTTPLLIAQDLSAEDMDRSRAEKAAQEEAGR
jgi:nucleotide-binding universal stress UspA family protein